MHPNSVLLFALVSTYVNAVPLNINLGAYSPALVVGDGEISFGGRQDVSNLMNALEGAAVSGAAAAAAQPVAVAQAAAAQPAAAQVAQAQALPGTAETTQITALQGMGKEIAPRVVKLIKPGQEKRDINGFNAALKYASDAIKNGPLIQLGTGEGGSGVGIKQNPGISAPQPAAAAKVVFGRREAEPLTPKMKTTVTTMFIRGGAVPEGG